MLGTIGKRCKEQLGIGLEVTDSAREHLIDKGYDDKYGARPLRRTIQNLVEDRMAEEMLDGRIKAGSLVEVGFDGEKLTSVSYTHLDVYKRQEQLKMDGIQAAILVAT